MLIYKYNTSVSEWSVSGKKLTGQHAACTYNIGTMFGKYYIKVYNILYYTEDLVEQKIAHITLLWHCQIIMYT